MGTWFGDEVLAGDGVAAGDVVSAADFEVLLADNFDAEVVSRKLLVDAVDILVEGGLFQRFLSQTSATFLRPGELGRPFSYYSSSYPSPCSYDWIRLL